uniref:Uncharacterized protein n=1 Tax=Anopheles epiroticus TaxID=199890 RepID=A0A182PFW4_9DIPT
MSNLSSSKANQTQQQDGKDVEAADMSQPSSSKTNQQQQQDGIDKGASSSTLCQPSTSKAHQLKQQQDASEHDAVNNRFIERREPTVAYCIACRSEFTFSLTTDIIQHYLSRRHEPSCRCLYCNGPMYQYLTGKNELQYYHDCHRSKHGLDPS